LALARYEVSIKTLNQAIEWDPRNAATYRARLLVCQAHEHQGDLKQAESALLGNLNDDYLTPASLEWRESLFELGRLLHLDGRYEEAIARLEEAVGRYPAASETPRSRYLIADSYRQLARRVHEKIEATVVESARLALTKEMQRLLAAAIAQFDEAIAALSQLQDTREVTSAERVVLRNSVFLKGSALFDLGRYEEAISAYSTATNRYRSSPEVLDAYVHISDCYRRLKRPSEARGTVEQAKVVLNQLPADASFADTSNPTRQEWVQYLDWLSQL
jgi:tetratricopeptide (TPR) repeat protein